jgi:hypothetical protein
MEPETESCGSDTGDSIEKEGCHWNLLIDFDAGTKQPSPAAHPIGVP